jgi:hypothetical protein
MTTKLLRLSSAALLLAGCTTAPLHRAQLTATTARVTFYSRGEDKYGSKIASGGRATEGRTVAMEKSIPFGTPVVIPFLRGVVGGGEFVCEDRGRDVNKRKASYGKYPVIDVYCANPAKRRRLSYELPEYMEVYGF